VGQAWHSKTSLFRGHVERRLVTGEDDSALQTLGGLQFMIELAFWAAHPGWPESIVGAQRRIPASRVRGTAETSTGFQEAVVGALSAFRRFCRPADLT
jgi:hypothetical protein